jgi:hypothetical protein
MADDINKKITIDVLINSNAQDQTTVFENLRTAVSGIGKAAAVAEKEVSATKAQMAAPPSENAFKTFFSNILGYYKQKQKSVTDSEKKSQDGINDNTLSTIQATNDKVVANTKSSQDKIRTSAIDSAQKTADSVFTIVTKGIEEQSNAKVSGLETDRKAIEANASLSAADKKQQENKIYQQEYQVKLKAFKEEQKANIAQAIMNGAIAVTKAEAELGPIAGTLALGAIVAQTAAQVATIKAQQPPTLQTAAKGGYFKSDGKGAVLPGYSKTDNVNAYIRSGEAVIVSEAMRDPWARNLVSAVNVAYGGRDFSVPNFSKGYAVGGIFTDGGNANRYYNQPMNDNKNLANTIAYQMINNFPPVYVDVKDINNQQNILAQTVNRVNL